MSSPIGITSVVHFLIYESLTLAVCAEATEDVEVIEELVTLKGCRGKVLLAQRAWKSCLHEEGTEGVRGKAGGNSSLKGRLTHQTDESSHLETMTSSA
eukprot:410157-Pyramimonas_sp.AAC.1